jgi:hypothetical protein
VNQGDESCFVGAVSAMLALLIKVFIRRKAITRNYVLHVPCPRQQQLQDQEQQQQWEQQHFTAHLLTDAHVAEQALLSLPDVHVVGLDCEWQPERGKQHNRIALLQLAVGGEHGCLLLQLQQMHELPAQLVYILQDPSVVKV